MIPNTVVFVENFPQTANGKLDKKALPDPPQPVASTGRSNDDNEATETMGLLDTLDLSLIHI